MCGFWVHLGDVACHMISVGTCCLNMHVHLWASGSAVKSVRTVSAKVGTSNLAGNPCIL